MNQRIALIFIMLLSLMIVFDGYSKQQSIVTVDQRLFPTQDSTLSFIVSKRKIGIYDHVHQKEVFSKEQVAGIEISPINAFKAYIDILVENGVNKLTIDETYILSRQRNEEVIITKVEMEKREGTYDHAGYYYENSIRLIDNDKVVHNLSTVAPSSTQKGLTLFQKSGVYSINENRFVIPPMHIKIETIRSPEYEKEGPLFFKSLSIEEDESIHQMGYYDKEGYLYGLPLGNFRYGLYSADFQELIEPRDAKIEPMRFGGFHTDKIKLYDKSGKHFSTDGIGTSDCEEVFISEHFIIVHHSVYKEKNQSDEKVYSFYDKSGQFKEHKSMEVSSFLQVPKIALGLVTSYDEDFEYITTQGVFDFDKRAFVIPNIYDEIKVENEDQLDYYFSCLLKDSLIYYNSDFQLFTPSSK